ncbi:MAG: NAD-dependent succinate-semialdehyde dehydrogenase [Verrucomicrobia bacterium]|nr:MAG: NAD-dependent succinate-semialdehyde dehydrogenase [Verrucomicrobiota bacterium]
MFQSINPATDEILAEYPEMTAADTRRVLRLATAAFTHWSRTDFAERSALLNSVAEHLRSDPDPLARLATLEMGKTITEARAEITKCAWVCEHYGSHAEAFLADETVDLGDGRRARIAHRPLGPLLAIMPWNFPFWQVFRAAVPALMAGNVVVLKHAANVTGCALAIEALFRRCGFPEGVFSVLRLPGSAMRRIIRSRSIAAVTLTGSTEAGRKVASAAGAALKKTVLELGGSDPYLVLEDADLDLAARTCARARMINAGQSCIAAKRFIVVESIRKAFEQRLVAEMERYTTGDPLLESTRLAPLARRDLRAELHRQVRASLDAGARLLLGGNPPPDDTPGAFYPATVLTDVRPGMPAFDEETFGPVAAIIAARNEKEAIRLANRTTFGLGSAVFTRDLERGTRIARDELLSGGSAVNTFVQSDPRLPFGGIRDSGYGRELGPIGIREFVNTKTILLG